MISPITFIIKICVIVNIGFLHYVCDHFNIVISQVNSFNIVQLNSVRFDKDSLK